MLLHNINYFIFLAAVFLFYYILPKKLQPIIILVSSIVFCAIYNIFTVYAIIFSTSVFYFTGIISAKIQADKKGVIIKAGITISVLILILLKYIINYRTTVNPENIKLAGVNFDVLSIAIPIGISYYTFTGIGYLIEILNGRTEVERNLLTFANFIVFFPKFSSGPIERSNKFLTQLKAGKSFDYELAVSGLKLIVWGMFKKVVIADRVSVIVDAAYKTPESAGGIVILMAAVLYSIQIYTDFSGYTDIARGSARMLGFRILDNFKRPYFSRNISEFWTRWHISLSSWVRDYVFLPLAYKLTYSKHKYFASSNKLIYLISTTVTMSIIGIWHGTGTGFLIWSLIHIVFLYYGFVYKKKKARVFKSIIKSAGIRNTISIFVTFILITFSWIFFRAESAEQLVSIFKGFNNSYSYQLLISFLKENGIFPIEVALCFVFPVFLFFIEYLIEKRGTVNEIISKQNIIVRFSLYIIFVLIILYFSVDNEKFIYFQF